MKANLLIFFVSAITGIVILEFFTRKKGDYASYQEQSANSHYVSPFAAGNSNWYFTQTPFSKIDYKKIEFHTQWKANNEGLKDKNLAVEKKGKRILILGDSFTEGVGAPNDKSYPRQLEKMVAASTDSALEIINGGLCAADIFSEYMLFKDKLLRYNPDCVLVTLNSTDLYEFSIRSGFERFVGDNKLQYRQSPWFEPFYAKSYLARYIIHGVLKYDYRFLLPKEQTLMAVQAHKEISSAIDSFRVLCNIHGIKFGIVFHPLIYDFHSTGYAEMNPLLEYCKRNKIAYTDEYEFLRSNQINDNNYKKVYWEKDGHFNSDGYELLAKCAFAFIEKERWFNLTDGHILTENGKLLINE